jgi:hypothetical protein
MAANADGVIESWQCELKDDAKVEDVQAVNSTTTRKAVK